jgi:RNA polymerase sigma factor (sigma-70 family)
MKSVLTGVPTEKLSPEREAELLLAGDTDTVIAHNLREAAIYAKGSSQGRGLSDGELVSAAFDGLTAAIKNFKPDRITFFAYAKPYVRGALSRATRSNCVVRTVREAEPLPDEEPEEDETECYVPPWRLSEGHEPELETIFLKDEWAQIRPVLFEVLDEKERLIIELSYIGGLNLREISDLLGVSRSDIHHSRMEALKKVRNRLMDNNQFSRE